MPLRSLRLLLILFGVMLGMLVASLGQAIVRAAMPRVVVESGGTRHDAWVFTGYRLASTVTVAIYRTRSDRYGRRPFFLLMVLFLRGSALSGLSQDLAQLIAFRTVQGLGAGAMLPIAPVIIGDLFPRTVGGRWHGLPMAVFSVDTIVKPVAGGLITGSPLRPSACSPSPRSCGRRSWWPRPARRHR